MGQFDVTVRVVDAASGALLSSTVKPVEVVDNAGKGAVLALAYVPKDDPRQALVPEALKRLQGLNVNVFDVAVGGTHKAPYMLTMKVAPIAGRQVVSAQSTSLSTASVCGMSMTTVCRGDVVDALVAAALTTLASCDPSLKLPPAPPRDTTCK